MTPDRHTLREAASKSFTDPRTVLRVINGLPVYSTTKARVVPVLREMGIMPELAPDSK